MTSHDVESGSDFTPRFDTAGLVTAVVTDADHGGVLMVAHMNREAINRTLGTGQVHFWSRSRGQLWLKGATSGNFLTLVEMRVDCDQDALWVIARPAGPACHTGAPSCFYRCVTDATTLVHVGTLEDG
ncbi:MAG: phosphoribosyl-AMP cyclohydrolase [Sphingopyxis sp.]|nr:phosphoribosyl-AMP cyclohydrolase [Sphingopyxis sp.]